MRTLDEYLAEADRVHGHRCAGQVLGVRLAMYALARLGIDDPQGEDRKRLVTFLEIDRCATDAIAVVTGCRLGKRALKFRDFGKLAATFVDLQTGRALRVSARATARDRARSLFPDAADANERETAAYQVLPDDDLFDTQWVRVELPPQEFTGYRADRVSCAECGESISFAREVIRDGRPLCRACAGERYYTVCDESGPWTVPEHWKRR